MRRSGSAPLRVITLIVGVAVALTGSPPARAAASPSASPPSESPATRGAIATNRTVTLQGSANRLASTVRPARHVVVRDLPAARTGGPTYSPRLRSPKLSNAAGGGRAPRIPLGTKPVEAIVTTLNKATEAVAAAGMPAPLPGPFEPPDPWIAVGPDHVIQATNAGIRIVDRTAPAQSTVKPLYNFFGLDQAYPGPDPQAETFDPRVIYDSLHGRWIAAEASFDCLVQNGSTIGTGYIDVAISDSADPTGGWGVVSVPYPDTVPDYPGLGTSTDKVVLSANVFDLEPAPTLIGCDIGNPGTLAGTELDVLGWAQLLGTGKVDITYLTSYPGTSTYPNEYLTLRPAVQVPATSPTVFGIGDHASAGDGIAYFMVSGLPSSHTVGLAWTDLTSGSPGIGPFAAPPSPLQPGTHGTIADAIDQRPTDALWQNSRLVFVSTHPCDPSGVAVGRDCVRVTELNTSTAVPSLRQDFLIAEPGTDQYMGGIGLSGSSDLHVVWTRSSETAPDYPSTWTAYQRAGAPANTLAGEQQLAAGTDNYPGDRWGDYVGVAQDPQVADAVWQADEASAGPTDWWSTHVSQLRTFGGASYVPITPVRVLDSRPGGVGLTGVFSAGVPRAFFVRGVGTIPSGAIAVTGNVTVVGQTAAGFVAVTPTATATPTSSTINFPLGDIRANNFTLPLGALGKLAAVYKAGAGKTTNLIVDITGYFVADASHAKYATITPTRVMDSRPAPYHVGPLGTFSANVPQTLLVAGFGSGLIPGNATAITGNITVVGQTRAGYVSVTPNPPVGTPPSSTINVPLGDIRANGLTADLNGAGNLSITFVAKAGATANILLDVTGYYVDGGVAGLLYYPLTPGRLMDSRPGAVLTGLTGVFTSGTPRKLDTDGHWGVPAGAAAITGNLTVVGQTAAGFVADTPTSIPVPAVSTLNFPIGDIRANGITVPLGAGDQYLVYRATAGKTTHLILDLSGYFQ